MLLKNAAAWSAFGLMATYQRDADAMIMIVVLPSLLARLRLCVNDMWAWSVLAGVIAASVGPSIGSLHIQVDAAAASNIFRFLYLRQASMAAAFLTILLTGEAWSRISQERDAPEMGGTSVG